MIRSLVHLTLAAALLAGCATSRDAQIKSDMAAMRRASDPNVLRDRGEASANVGDLSRAEQYYVAALRSGADERDLTRRLLCVCVADGRYPAALDYAEDFFAPPSGRHRHPLRRGDHLPGPG